MGVRSRLAPLPDAFRGESGDVLPSRSGLDPNLWTAFVLTFLRRAEQLILADKYDRYELKYEGCRIFNPGSFRATEFGWSTYYFATGKVERR